MEKLNWPKITADTPMEEIKRIHKEIWNYVIKHGMKPLTPYFNNCVACEYGTIHGHPFEHCLHCPIKWSNGYDCNYTQSLYNKWCTSSNIFIKKYYARLIRNVSWKFEKENK